MGPIAFSKKYNNDSVPTSVDYLGCVYQREDVVGVGRDAQRDLDRGNGFLSYHNAKTNHDHDHDKTSYNNIYYNNNDNNNNLATDQCFRKSRCSI